MKSDETLTEQNFLHIIYTADGTFLIETSKNNEAKFENLSKFFKQNEYKRLNL